MISVCIGVFGLQNWFGGDFAPVLELAAVGATMVELHAHMYCRGPTDFEGFCRRLVAIKGSGSAQP